MNIDWFYYSYASTPGDSYPNHKKKFTIEKMKIEITE